MILRLYVCNDNENVINKSLTFQHETEIKLKETVNISSPVIVLSEIEGVNLLKCNYCFLSEFNRYYFIRDIEVSRNVYIVYLECDVLESYKDDILNSYSEYTTPIRKGDYLGFNGLVDVRKEINVYDFELNLVEPTIILTTMGGD